MWTSHVYSHILMEELLQRQKRRCFNNQWPKWETLVQTSRCSLLAGWILPEEY